ncbi:hypothetical protein [Arthrobacter psychrolactophilus]
MPLIAVALTWLQWQDKLPAELASHWSDTGAPDDFMATGTALGLGFALTGIPAAIALASAFIATLRPALFRGIVGFAGMISGMGAGTWLISAGLTLQAGSAEKAVLGWWLAALIASFLFGAVPYFIAPKPKFTSSMHETRLPLGEKEAGAWRNDHLKNAAVAAGGAPRIDRRHLPPDDPGRKRHLVDWSGHNARQRHRRRSHRPRAGHGRLAWAAHCLDLGAHPAQTH